MKDKKWIIIAIIVVIVIVVFFVLKARKAKKERESKYVIAKNPSNDDGKRNPDKI